MAEKDLGAYEIRIKADVSQLEEANEAAQRAEKSADKLSGTYQKQARSSDVARAAAIKQAQAQNKLDQEFREGRISVTQYSQKMAILEQQYKRFNNATGAMSAETKRLQWQIQQAGFQFSDFFTQIASGTDAVRAASQQFPQLVQGMGMAGIGLSVLASAAGAAFMAFSNGADEAEESVKGFRSEAELLRDALRSISEARRQAAAEDPGNLLGNIEDQRRQLSEFIGEINTAINEAGQIERVFAGPSAQGNQFRAANLESLKEMASLIQQVTGQEIELNETYNGRQGLLDAFAELRSGALEAVRELNLNEQDINDELGEENAKSREAQQLAEQRLSAINAQLDAIEQGSSALDAQRSLQRDLVISQQISRGVSKETAEALFDQAEAMDRAVEAEKERLKNINTVITARMKERDWLGDHLAGQEKLAAQERERIANANVSAEQQLSALRAQMEAIEGGATATDAAFLAQQNLLEAQLLSRGVTKETVDETLRLKGAIRAAGQDAGSSLADGFESAASQIAGSVTNAVISGDWEGTGEQIGATLGAAIGTAFAGPIGGAVGGILGGSLFGGGGEPYTGAQDRAEEVKLLLGDIANKSDLISSATDATATALNELIGANRELLGAQKSAEQSLSGLGISVANELAALYFGGDGFANLQGSTFANAATFGGLAVTPERAKLSAVDDIGFILSGAINNIDVRAFQDLGGMIFESYLPGLESGFQGALDQGIKLIEQLGGSLGFTAEQIEASIAAVDPSRLGMIGTAGMGAEEQAELAAATVNQLLIDAASGLDGVSALLTDVSDDSISALTRTANNISTVTGSLAGFNDSLGQLTSLELGQAANNLVDLFGEGSALSSAVSNIFSTFASDEQQATRNLAQLQSEFQALGLAVPTTNEAVIDLVAGLDLTTSAGRAALEAISRSTDGLSDLFDTIEDGIDGALSTLRTSINSEQSAMRDSLSDQLDLLGEQRAAAIAANKLQIDASKDRVSLLRAEVRGIQGAISALRGSSEFMVESDRRGGLADLQAILASGGVAGAGAAAEFAAQLNEGLFGSASAFEAERGKTLAALEQLDERGGTQLTTAEQQLAAAQMQTTVIKGKFDDLEDAAREQAEDQITALEDIFNANREQIDVLRGIDNSVLSVTDAIDGLRAAMAASTAVNAPSPTDLVVGSMDVMPQDFSTSLQTGDIQVMPAFANGGLHDGGMALVGERGPEIAMMGAARVVPNSSLSDILGGMEIAGLRDDMRRYFLELLKTDKGIQKILQRFDTNGILKRDETVVQ